MTVDQHASTSTHDHRSLGDLLTDLSHQTATLVRQEVDLVKTETRAKLRALAGGAALTAVAAVLGLLAAGALVACMIAALSHAIPVWAAALVVGVVIGALAAVGALIGVAAIRRAVPPVPREAMESVKEDVRWITTRS